MNKSIAFGLLATLSLSAHAQQETFVTAGALDCTAISVCVQPTADGLFTLSFAPTYPFSAPSATGFNVVQPSVEIRSNGAAGLLDLGILRLDLTGSNAYNGVRFLGGIKLETQDGSGAWKQAAQWSTTIGAAKGVYVVFNGMGPSAPLVKGVRAVRLTGVNGATAFKIGMMSATAR